MPNYIPLHLHTHYSLLDSISTPINIVKRITELNIDACAMSDHGSLSGAIEFFKAMRKADKKPIIGCELYLSEHAANIKNEHNRKHTHLIVLAKNDNGWNNLIKLTSEANKPENFYYKPRLSLNELSQFSTDLIAFGGHYGSIIANELIDANGNLLSDAIDKGISIINRCKDIFGNDFYLESQLIDYRHKYLVDIIRELAQKTNIKVIATGDSHYVWNWQAEDQQVAIATNMNKTIYECTDPAFGLSSFFTCKQYYIHSYDEMLKLGNTEEELENTLEIANRCDIYKNLLRSPILPPFKCPENYKPDTWLLELCNRGMKNKIENKVKDITIYQNRLEKELDVIQNANLSSYFLIVLDILQYVKDNKWLLGPARGSSGGCLISYLIGITAIDPIKHDLLFERFFNGGRVVPNNVSFEEFSFQKFIAEQS